MAAVWALTPFMVGCDAHRDAESVGMRGGLLNALAIAADLMNISTGTIAGCCAFDRGRFLRRQD